MGLVTDVLVDDSVHDAFDQGLARKSCYLVTDKDDALILAAFLESMANATASGEDIVEAKYPVMAIQNPKCLPISFFKVILVVNPISRPGL